jgi:hypothetical protein
MRINEITEEQASALFAKVAARLPDALIEHHRYGVRWTQTQIIVGLLVAGFCACATLWAIASAIPEASWPASGSVVLFAISIPWYVWALLSAVAGSFCFVAGCSWFAEHEESMRAGERAHLLLMLEELSKADVELSTEDAISLIKSVPDSLPWQRK